MSLEISLNRLKYLFGQILGNYDFQRPIPSIMLSGKVVLLLNYRGEAGLCVPLDWYGDPPTTEPVELKYIHEILTVEEMLTHESEEVRILGSRITKEVAYEV